MAVSWKVYVPGTGYTTVNMPSMGWLVVKPAGAVAGLKVKQITDIVMHKSM